MNSLFRSKWIKCITLTIFVIVNSRVTSGQTFTKIIDGGIVNEANNSYFATWGDYDRDGDIDLFHSLFSAAPNNPAGNNFLFQNNFNGGFTKVSNIPGGLVTDGLTGGYSCWIDYDNDNDLDLYVGPGKYLYENQGNGSFIKVIKQITSPNLPTYTTGPRSAAFADYDNDGFLDVYLGKQEIYKGNGSGDFTMLSVAPFTSVPASNRSDGIAWADYDNDGYMDIYVASSNSANSLFHNNGNGTFTSITSYPDVTGAMFAYGCAWGDYDNDQDLDLWVADNNSGGSRLLRNNGNGTFTRILGDPIVTTSFVSQAGAGWADYDNDGDLDFFVPTFSQNILFDNNGNGTFTENTTEIVGNDVNVESYGAGWADYDNDGDLDLFVPTAFGNPNDLLYRNNTTQNNPSGGKWLKVHCQGTISNTSAIGARVYVRALIGSVYKWQMREINANTTRGGESGGVSGNVIHFGLGDAPVIDILKIVWPASGITQQFNNVAVNQSLEIVENQSAFSSAEPATPDMPVANPGFVTGKIFKDENNNCTFETGIDLPLANKAVQADPGAYFAFTDNNGNYSLSLPAGNYTISQNQQNDPWVLSSCQSPTTYNVSVSASASTPGINFSNLGGPIPCNGNFILDITDMGIDGCDNGQGAEVVFTSPCPGHPHRYCFTLTNNSTGQFNAGTVLSVTFPLNFAINTPALAFAGNCMSSNWGPLNINANNFNISLVNTLPAGASTCVVCITVDVGAGQAPYITTANYTNTFPIVNLIVNPQFNNGTTGFTSNYTLNCAANSAAPGLYCVGPSAVTLNSPWAQLGFGGVGNALFADGHGTAGTPVWVEGIPVNINTNYNFTSWFNNIVNPNGNFLDPPLQVLINGTLVASTPPIPENPDMWTPAAGLWCADSDSAYIRISSSSSESSGNDFGLDEISFFAANAASAIHIDADTCGCDPNDLAVTPAGCSANGNVRKNQKLNYRIRFQNVGGGNAHNILIRDPIDSDLDLGTLQILSSSHTITHIEIIPDNALIIKFDGIELPPFVNDPVGCNGYVEFSISPKAGLAEGTSITNQAGIYFDNNNVVLTNTTLNTLYNNPLPDARFSYKHDCTSTGMTYDFTYTGSTADNATFFWEFTDGSPATSSSQNPSDIVFNSAGSKQVKLTITRHGCAESVIINVMVNTVFTSQNKVLVCHLGTIIEVSQSSLSAHLAHGDCVGACASSSRIDKPTSESLFNIQVNPNPASGQFTCTNQNIEGAFQLIVYNVLGKEVERFEKIEPQQSISFGSEYVPGLYIATFNVKGEKMQLKLIKQKTY